MHQVFFSLENTFFGKKSLMTVGKDADFLHTLVKTTFKLKSLSKTLIWKKCCELLHAHGVTK